MMDYQTSYFLSVRPVLGIRQMNILRTSTLNKKAGTGGFTLLIPASYVRF